MPSLEGSRTQVEQRNSNEAAQEWVALRCDDRIFYLLRSTLAQCRGSLFDLMFSSTPASDSTTATASGSAALCPFPLFRDETHPLRPYVLDRTARYVEPLLTYFRTGELILDSGVNPAGVLREAEYFNVEPVVALLKKAMESSTEVTATPLQTRRNIEKILMSSQPDTPLRFRGVCLRGLDLSGLDLRSVDFTNCDLSEANLSKADLRRAVMTRCKFVHANLNEAECGGAVCTFADFSRASLVGTKMVEACCADAVFASATIVSADMSSANLEGCDFTNADLMGTILQGAHLRRVNFTGVDRRGTSLAMGGVIH